jgi:uncharacterized membrane protein YqiK
MSVWFFASLIVLLIAAAIVIALLNRFYRKATRERALIRTGAGGKRVVLDGGFVAVPFLHRVEDINMRTMRLEVDRSGEQSLMTEDRLRVDTTMEFYLRVVPTDDGVSTAAQAIGARALNPDDLQHLFEGRFVDAMQNVVAQTTMDALHENRAAFVDAVQDKLADRLQQNGLMLESASLTRLDQASFSSLDENNAFNAVGLRRLAEVIASNRKQRAEIEADADVSVRQTQLAGIKRRLEIEREQQQAEITQGLHIEQLKADTEAQRQQSRQLSEQLAEQSRIQRERETRASEIQRDRELREMEVAALLAAESAKIDSQIELTRKRAEEIAANSAEELARREIIVAQETVQLERERLAAERELEISSVRVRSENQTNEDRVASEVKTMLEKVQAESKAAELRSVAIRNEKQAEADGKVAVIKAENEISERIAQMKLQMHKVDKLPELARQMMKPVEKIDSIRINQVSGLNAPSGGNSGPVNGAVDGVLNMALQLPAMQKLGESIGVNLDVGGLDKQAEQSVSLPVESDRGDSGRGSDSNETGKTGQSGAE